MWLLNEAGPTRVGDSDSDVELMNFLDAEIRKEPGSPLPFYESKFPIRAVMNKLAEKGYRLVSSCGIGQTFVATMFKDSQ